MQTIETADNTFSLEDLEAATTDHRTALERRQDELEASREWGFQHEADDDWNGPEQYDCDEWTEHDELQDYDQAQVEQLLAEQQAPALQNSLPIAAAVAIAVAVTFLLTVTVLP